MDDEFYQRLGEHFTAAQIIELGFTCAAVMGLHRFIHTLDIYGESRPVIDYSPDQVDSAASRDRADRFGRDPEAAQDRSLYATRISSGIRAGRRPVPFDVGPHDAVDGQRFTVGIDLAKIPRSFPRVSCSTSGRRISR